MKRSAQYPILTLLMPVLMCLHHLTEPGGDLACQVKAELNAIDPNKTRQTFPEFVPDQFAVRRSMKLIPSCVRVHIVREPCTCAH